MTGPTLEFWYEFASTYSYLSAMWIEPLAERAGVTIRWRPFLLGPIFAAQGWTTSPFNMFPAKGRHMWRDLEREAAALRLPPISRPEPFPQNTVLAARVALVGADAPWGAAFAKAVFTAEFAEARPISDRDTIASFLAGLALDPSTVLVEAEGGTNKARLRSVTAEAASRGIFGAPSFICPDGELFWGNDRLEQAIAWTARVGSGRP